MTEKDCNSIIIVIYQFSTNHHLSKIKLAMQRRRVKLHTANRQRFVTRSGKAENMIADYSFGEANFTVDEIV